MVPSVALPPSVVIPRYPHYLSLLSVRSGVETEDGRTYGRTDVPNEDQRGRLGTSECPPTSSRTHPSPWVWIADTPSWRYNYIHRQRAQREVYINSDVSIRGRCLRRQWMRLWFCACSRENLLAVTRGRSRKLKTAMQSGARVWTSFCTELNCGGAPSGSRDYITAGFLSPPLRQHSYRRRSAGGPDY